MKTAILSLAIGLTLSTAALAQTNTSGSQSGASSSVNVISPGRIDQRLRSAPSAIAPGLAASAVEACLGSVSGGGSGMGWGISLGGTVKDEGCEARLDARTLHSLGMTDAALYRLCERPKMAIALAQAGTPCPQHRQQVVSRQSVSPTRQAAANVAPVSGGGRWYNHADQRWETR